MQTQWGKNELVQKDIEIEKKNSEKIYIEKNSGKKIRDSVKNIYIVQNNIEILEKKI